MGKLWLHGYTKIKVYLSAFLSRLSASSPRIRLSIALKLLRLSPLLPIPPLFTEPTKPADFPQSNNIPQANVAEESNAETMW